MREMRQQGYSYQAIAEVVGVSKQRIFQLLNNYKNTGRKNREEKYRNFGKCQECNRNAEILHHIDFNNANDENSNLTRLCQKCHTGKHTGRLHNTHLQSRLQRRNKEIRDQAKERPIEELALVYKISIPSIYRILKHE